MTLMLLVLGACELSGVQLKTPLAGSRLAPVGPLARVNVRTFGGGSVSVAMFVNVMLVNSAIVRVVLLRLVMIGAALTSLTTIVNCWVALMVGTPLSVTRTVTR